MEHLVSPVMLDKVNFSYLIAICNYSRSNPHPVKSPENNEDEDVDNHDMAIIALGPGNRVENGHGCHNERVRHLVDWYRLCPVSQDGE